MQKGCSIVVHSVINSIDPPGSAEMSHIATSLKRTSTLRSEHGTLKSPTRLKRTQNERCLGQFLRWLPRLLAFSLQLPVCFWDIPHLLTMSFRLHKEEKKGERKGEGNKRGKSLPEICH